MPVRATLFCGVAVRLDCVRATDALRTVVGFVPDWRELRTVVLVCAVRALIAERAADVFCVLVVRGFCGTAERVVVTLGRVAVVRDVVVFDRATDVFSVLLVRAILLSLRTAALAKPTLKISAARKNETFFIL